MSEPCSQHRAFQPDVHVQILHDRQDGEDCAYMMLVEMTCTDCGTQFWFPGVRAGQSFNEPRVTPDKRKLIFPIRPAGVEHLAMDTTPDIDGDGQPEGAPSSSKEEQIAAVIRALQAPQGFAIQVPNEHMIHYRARAVLNAIEAAR